MKQYLILIIIFGLSLTSAYSQSNIFPENVNVGIGDTDPQFMLTLKRSSTNGDAIGIFKSDESLNLDFYSVYNGTSDAQSGSFAYGVRPSDNAWQVWERRNNLQWTALFTIKKDGNVGIGTSDTKGYKLAIAGNMIARIKALDWI